MCEVSCNIAKRVTWSWKVGSYESKPVTVELGGSDISKGVWTALDSGISGQHKTISTKRSGGRVRAWSGELPKNNVEAEQDSRKRLLGYMPTQFEMVSQKGKTCTKRASIGVNPDLMRTASEAELAAFLAMLTAQLWSLGNANLLDVVVSMKHANVIGSAGGGGGGF